MSNKRDPTESGRDMDAEAVASRSGLPIEHAKDVVDKTVARPPDMKDGAVDPNLSIPDDRER